MALTSTIVNFDIDLSHIDRGVYETLALRVAMHPSESPAYLTARVLAFALEYTDGIAFSAGGISEPDEPAIAVRDLTGALLMWLDVGMPDAARLHKAGKLARRVVVYTHRDPAQLMAQLEGQRIHRADALEIYSFDRSFIEQLAGRLERRMAFGLTVSDGQLLVAIGDDVLEGPTTRHVLTARQ